MKPGEARKKKNMTTNRETNAEVARLIARHHEQSLKNRFPNIISISDAVRDIGDPQDSHVVAIYLRDDKTSGIPSKLDANMPDGSIKSINTEIITGAGVGEIYFSQKDMIQTSGGLSSGSICCKVDTNKGFNAIVTSGHVYSCGKNTDYKGILDVSMQTPVMFNGANIGTWYFQKINFNTDIALFKVSDPALLSDVKSFAGHYIVTDKDVCQTRVVLLSQVYGERTGYILDHNKKYDIPYNVTETKFNVIRIGSSTARNDSVQISERGDSGGCVFEPTSGKLVGIILGGDGKFTFVLPLKELFDSCNFKLL